MALKIDALCPTCGAGDLYVRTSNKISNTIDTQAHCKSCGTRFEVASEIRRVQVAEFREVELRNLTTLEQWSKKRAEAKLKPKDERQTEIPMD